MRGDDEILESVRQDPELAGMLAELCEFDITRGDRGTSARLSSGQPLDVIAGDFTGGRYFLCGPRRPTRSVLYASSEGQAGLIGRSLVEALEIMIGLPSSWHDCLGYSGNGDLATMQSTAEHLQRDEAREHPEISAQRAELAAALSLDLPSVPELLARLRDAVAGSTPEFIFSDETGEHESLFGPWTPDRNHSWR